MGTRQNLLGEFTETGRIKCLTNEDASFVVPIGRIRAKTRTQVATRCRVPGNFSGAVFQLMARTYHHARDLISGMQIGIPNWYVGSGVEAGIGGPATVTATVEYPLGTILGRFKFAGANTGTIADMQTGLSDYLKLPVSIPNGVTFAIRIYYTNAAGIPFLWTDGIGADQAGGDVAQYAASGIADLTGVGGTFTNTQGGVGFGPVCIITETDAQSYAIAGDSKASGKGDSPSDATGFGGPYERAIGPKFPFINIANAGASSASFWGAGSNMRRQLLGFINSGVVFDAGTNDILGTTAATLIFHNIVQARQSVPELDFWPVTQAPMTTGTWNGAGGAGQTVMGTEPIRLSLNNLLRSGANTTFTGLFDVCPVLEYTAGGAKWQANYTADGVHPAQVASQAVAASGVVAVPR